MKNVYTKATSILKQPGGRQIATSALALLAVVGVSYFGTHLQRGSHAATPGTLYMAPASATVTPGSTVSVAIHEDSGTDGVNAVQADMQYDASQLQFSSITEGTAFPNVSATSTGTPGDVRVARSINTGNADVTGDNVIVTVNFKVLATSGTANLSFNSAYSMVVRSSDNVNIMNSVIGASYTVKYPAPTVSTVSPASASINGGASATINGSGFMSGASVKFGGTAATNVTVVSANKITATVPAHAAGAVNVVVTNPDGQSVTASNGFSYVNDAPTICSVSPATGPSTGGTTVTICGTNFLSGATVKFGTVLASSVTFISATSLKAVTPSYPNGGTVGITVTNPDGQSVTKSSAFVYNLPPVVSSVSPSSGFTNGGGMVTIQGSNFAAGATVVFGGTAATNITVVNASTITAVAPAHGSGAVPVTVTNANGLSGTTASGFTYRVIGDSNGDGRVNATDLSILISHDSQNYPVSDFNNDGTVNAADLAMLLAAWTW